MNFGLCFALVAMNLMAGSGIVNAAAERPAQKPRHLPPAAQHMPEVVVYEEHFGGDWLRTNLSYPNVANLNNKVSSIIVVAGTWRFCREYDFKDCREFKPGYYEQVLQGGDTGLDTISSFEPVK